MKEWFSGWPRLEVLSIINKLEDYCPEPEVPIVAIAAKNDFFTADLHHLTVNMVMGGWENIYRDFFEAKEDTRMFWRKDGGKCFVGKATEKNSKDISAKRDLVGRLIKQVKDEKCESILLLLGVSVAQQFFEALDAALSLLYRYDCFLQTESQEKHPSVISVIVSSDAAHFSGLAERMNHLMQSVFFSRDLVNRPPSEKKPEDIAKAIIDSMAKLGLSAETIDYQQMGLVKAVCRGSCEKPFVLVGWHCPPDKKNEKPIVLVGKGVCFDSGGINLKDDPKTMKGDMAGAAVVFGILRAVSLLKIPVHLVAIAPFVYNMPGGDAYKPDDIVVAYNGKTVEIDNTDAEGRLILADALAYAVDKFKPELIIDYATLTSACIVALGNEIVGVFTDLEENDWQLTQIFLDAGAETGEPHWPLPLYEHYWDSMKSQIANMKNIGSNKYGGAITAALFLKQFVGDIPWKHIDIAGVDIFGSRKRFWPEGATGFGVRSGIRFLEKYLANKK